MDNEKTDSNNRSASRNNPSSSSRSWAPLALFLGMAFLPACAKKSACLAVEQDTATLSCSPARLFALPKRDQNDRNSLTVTAMAYTASSVGKAGKNPPRAANGEQLRHGVNAIAVSPDLLEEHGLSLDKTVRISGLDGDFAGLEGEYKVVDLMSPRHSRTIDIYFGHDNAAARQWGKRTLTLTWE